MSETFLFWGAVILAFPILALMAFVMVVGNRHRLEALEGKLADLSRQVSLLMGRSRAEPEALSPAERLSPGDSAPVLEQPHVLPAAPEPPSSVVSPEPPPRLTPPLPFPRRPVPPIVPAEPLFKVDWESFTAAKVFSWVGGVALFLGVGFFIKFAADHGLIPPLVRVVLGLLAGIGCVAGGLKLRSREGVAVTAQTFCAAGVAILYADMFAARSLYGLADAGTAFVFMVLVTIMGFTLAVRMDSRHIALLGLAGGFLTPVLVSSGRDNPAGLFSYVALLDLGLAAVVFRKRWDFLWGLAALGTLGLEAGWMSRFFTPEKVVPAAVIQGFFPILFLAVARRSKEEDEKEPWIPGVGAAVSLLNMSAVFVMLSYGALAHMPVVLFAPLFVIDVALAAMVLKRDFFRPAHLAAGAVAFLSLSWEMSTGAASEQATWMYLLVLLFAGLHALFPVMLQRWKPSSSPWHAAYGVPALFFLPLLFPVVREAGSPFLFWVAVGVMNLVIVAGAVLSGVLWLVGAAFAMTLLLGFTALFHAAAWGGMGGFLGALLVIAGGFFGAGLWLSKRKKAEKVSLEDGLSAEVLTYLPSLSALLPFFLLVTAAGQPGWDRCEGLYGVGFLLAGLCVGLALLRGMGEAVPPALAGLALLQGIWWSRHGGVDLAPFQCTWLSAGLAAFLVPPLLFKKRLQGQKAPWLTAAAAGPVYFGLLYRVVHPDLLGPSVIGILPAVMALLYGLSLAEALGTLPTEAPHRASVLAAFGGVTLLFVSLIFPLQFDKEWITLGWAAEGAALLWLFRRIPHPGLKAWAGGLLALAFVRLAANPAVLEYHLRTGTPVFNWYFYVYGAGAAFFFLAARLWRPSDQTVNGWKVASVLNGFGCAALFLLMNIEIADFFSPGGALTFQFSGSVGQDMAYTLGWGLFGLACLVLGLARRLKGSRLAGTGLLGVSVGKLFLHDLWRLGALYRVAAFIGSAAVLIAASFLYQRYLQKEKRP